MEVVDAFVTTSLPAVVEEVGILVSVVCNEVEAVFVTADVVVVAVVVRFGSMQSKYPHEVRQPQLSTSVTCTQPSGGGRQRIRGHTKSRHAGVFFVYT